VWEASPKQETAARTIRPKISGLLPKFFTEFPALAEQKLFTGWAADQLLKENDWKQADEVTNKQQDVPEVSWCKPGESAAITAVQAFCNRLKTYGTSRNDPASDALSDLSPYFHFGQLAPQRACLEVRKYKNKSKESVESFLEECIIRRGSH
jgi:deoxyribodipyrimidine photo-lyase